MDVKQTFAWAVAAVTALGFTFVPLRAEDAPKPAAPAPAVKADQPKKDEPAPAPKKKPQSLEEAIASIPVEELDDASVLMIAGSIKIPYAAVEPMEKAAWMNHKKHDPSWDFGPGEQAHLRKQIGMKLLGNAVVEQYADNNKLTAPDEKYNQVFGKFKQAKEQRGGYERFLSDSGITDAAFQRFLRASVAIENQMAQTVTPDDTKKWLAEHNDEVPRRRVSEIMFTYKGAKGAPEGVKRTQEEAKKLADELLSKLKDNPDADFQALVKSMSDGPSARNAGDLGFIPQKGNTVESVADGVYKIEKVGGYSDVVESPFGYHVFKLTEIRGDAEILREIKDQLTSERFGSEMQKLMEEAVAQAKFNKKLL